MNEPVKLTRAEIMTICEGLARGRERLAQIILTWLTIERPDKTHDLKRSATEYLHLIEKLRKLPEFSDTED